MLTLEKLKEMGPHEYFATGVTIDSPNGVNMTNSGIPLRWVAVRGEIPDWAIYIAWAYKDEVYIAKQGDKVHSPFYIRRLVPCDDEAFKMYRS
jgi:hypothetical protein